MQEACNDTEKQIQARLIQSHDDDQVSGLLDNTALMENQVHKT